MKCCVSVDDDDDDDTFDSDDVTVRFLRPVKPEISLPVRSPSNVQQTSKNRWK